ncbi:type IV pilin-like G/H family protein [Oculatella sp. FACHB-28]|uniref:type IV pilin-like G/H family protein n=1 Tax=Oculatella sp. FACHB-28 TaxID=2692845 RepID=UPI0016873B05|nr:type IV pilin-like G/H family protein [Oculatella sp. FACHB-28]MBD2055509.1 type IV pilin-like G/H family protein [Oculatella sp. FACHB-28]
MKTELQAKFLQHLVQKKKENEGFTLIELLVVIIIIGILAAIALPSFLNQANKARESEAKTYVGSMNRGQQAYYLENGTFADNDNFGALGLGINTQTRNYKYVIAGGGGTNSTNVTNQGQPIVNTVKAFVGGVSLGTITKTSEATTLAVLCQAKLAPAVKGPAGTEVVADAQGEPTTVCQGIGNYDSIK